MAGKRPQPKGCGYQVRGIPRSHAPRGCGILGRSAAGVSVAASFSLRVFDRGAVPWREKDRSLKAAATKSKAFLVPTLRVGTEYLAALRPSKLHRLSQQKLDLRRQLLLHFWTVESHTHERDIPLLVDDEFRGDSGDLILFGEFFPRDFINQNRKGVFVIRYKFLRILDGGRQSLYAFPGVHHEERHFLVILVLIVHFLQVGKRCFARSAPGRPEVYHDHFSLQG